MSSPGACRRLAPPGARRRSPIVPEGLVISDLHLFSARSAGEDRVRQLLPRGQRSAVLVLNGDTFDFRWSRHRDTAASIEAALRWLEELLDRLPQTRLHLLAGNHDCLAAFEAAVQQRFAGHPRLSWHPHWLILGDRLFLHGDCAHRPMDVAGLARYRASWAQDPPRGGLAARAYVWLDRLRLTHAAHGLHFPHRRTIRRIAAYLDAAVPGWRDRIRHCHFGHTHRALSDYPHDGIRFHNSGCGILGMEFRPAWFNLPDALVNA